MRAIVKGFVVGTLGLAVVFGSPGVSLALPKAGGVECNGPLDHLPPGKMCPKGFAETNLHRQDGTCEVHCCRDTPDGKLDCSAPPVDAKLKAPRNVRPDLPATIYEPPAKVPPGGVRPPITAPSQLTKEPSRFDRTIATQKRLNRYFHTAVVPKLGTCWNRVQGAGTIAMEFTYTRAGSGWVPERLGVHRSTLPRGQEAVALQCMQDSVRATSFPVEQGEAAQTKFAVTWSFPVPWPADASARASAMFLAQGGTGGGGCDGHGAPAKCHTCLHKPPAPAQCKTVCVGDNECTLYSQGGCKSSGFCASGGPFGVAGGMVMY